MQNNAILQDLTVTCLQVMHTHFDFELVTPASQGLACMQSAL